MQIETTRFGVVTVADDRVLSFPKGLLGFPACTRWVLIESLETDDAAADAGDTQNFFWWLQSADEPTLAFVVTDPALFVGAYRVPVHADQLERLGVRDAAETQSFVIVNKVNDTLTGNLQGPLVINVAERRGEQLVLSDRRFTTRVPLMQVGPNAPTPTPAPASVAKPAPAKTVVRTAAPRPRTAAAVA